MITTQKTTSKLWMFAGLFILAAAAMVFPMDAFAAQTGNTIGNVNKNLGDAIGSIPKLLATGAYVMGGFLAITAVLKVKAFVNDPEDTPITSAVGFAVAAFMLILLPYVIALLRDTVGGQTETLSSSAKNFNDSGSANW